MRDASSCLARSRCSRAASERSTSLSARRCGAFLSVERGAFLSVERGASAAMLTPAVCLFPGCLDRCRPGLLCLDLLVDELHLHRIIDDGTPPHAMNTHTAGWVRVRVEIVGSQKCGIVGKSLSVLGMIDPMISNRTRRRWRSCFIEWTVHGRPSWRGFSRRGSSSRW